MVHLIKVRSFRLVLAIALAAVFVAPLLVGDFEWWKSDFDWWKMQMARHLPSAMEIPLKNDATHSLVFFFDPAANRLIVCWHQADQLPHGGSFGAEVDAASKAKAEVLPQPAAVFKASRYRFPFLSSEISFREGSSIQLRDRDVNQIEFAFHFADTKKTTTTHFRAERKGSSDWTVIELSTATEPPQAP